LNEVTELTLVVNHCLWGRWCIHHLLEIVVLEINQELVRVQTDSLSADTGLDLPNLANFILSAWYRYMIRTSRGWVDANQMLFSNDWPRSN
jgi:hypothetical protein